MSTLTKQEQKNFSRFFDHTLLKPEARESQIVQACQEALEFQFAAVCVNPFYVPQVAKLLKGSQVRVCSVVGFPLGAQLTTVKTFETHRVILEGAQEIDMVINIGALKDGKLEEVQFDIFEVVKQCRLLDAHCKVILETALLSDEEKVLACKVAIEGGAHFVKTSTGFGPGGATVHDVQLLKEAVKGSKLEVKAAGGIRSFADAVQMIKAGATRLGTSATVKIMQEFQEQLKR
jgi:deoxyribose-phosphate aldolase